jgi:CheY-like chemotaxis protein
MGSKILSDAGYTVVAVSNGAAAVKKIAAEHPDLAILDVFMPGYSGLEVCEKIKNAVETARMTVLLTVTNMEPYSAADGNRVKADGVLIKPFEATDLLAVMHKFEERLQAQARVVEAAAAAKEAEESEADTTATDSVSKPVEMPQELASAPALGIEEVESPATEAAPAFEAAPVVSVAAPLPEPEPVVEPAATEAAPAFEAAPELSVAAPLPEPEPVVEPAATEAAPVVETPAAQPAPVVQTPAAEEAGFVVEAPTLGEAALEMEPPWVADAAVQVLAAGEAGAEAPVVAAEPPVEEMQPVEAVEAAPPRFELAAPVETVSEPEGEAASELPAEAEPEAEMAAAAEAEFKSEPDIAAMEVALATEGQEGPVYGLGMGQDLLLADVPEDFAEFATKFVGEHAEDIPIGIAIEENSAAALEAIPELLVEPIDAAEEPSAGAAESTTAAEVAEAMPPVGETFEVHEPVVEPEPEPEAEPEYDTQRVHGAVEEPEYESRHIHLVNNGLAEGIEEIHDAAVEQQGQETQAPAVATEAEHEAPPAAAGVEQDPQEVGWAAAVEAPAIVEQEPAPETVATTVEEAEKEEPAPAVIEEPEPEMPQASVVVEEPEHHEQEIAAPEAAEPAPSAVEATLAVSEAPSALQAQVAQELERVQAEMVAPEPAAAEPEMEPPAQAAVAPLATMNEERVAEAVHRVLDRYKGELIAAIVSELKK